MTRPSKARVALSALRHNYRVARQQHGGRVLAVLKANAYGHGVLPCAQALAQEADGFAVAFMEEALALRAAGFQQPLLVLEGAFDPSEVEQAAELAISLVVHQADQVRMLELLPASLPAIDVWLKIDTGMRRVGFLPAQAREAYQRLQHCSHVSSITWMSHFARADELNCAATREQIALFDRATEGLPGAQSLCNSAGILAWPSARRDWGRAGLMLYGVEPAADLCHGLQPVMSLVSEVVAERWVLPGESVGYGAAFTAQRPTRVGLVPIGYADGYPRHVPPTGVPVMVAGAESQLLGRVSMDMLCVDLGQHLEIGVGSPVELWGPNLSVSRLAELAGTIPYELLCNVKRVSFQYDDGL